MTFAYSSVTQATAITGSISGTTLTVTARTGTLYVGSVLSATGVTTTQILRQLTGTPGSTGTYTVAISQTVTSFIAGIAVTSTITQTGTDTSLAGLTGLTGVSTIVNDAAGGYTSYSVGTNYLLINGTLSIGVSAPYEQLVCGFNTSTASGGTAINQAMLQVAGTLTLGSSVTANLITDGNQTQTLIYQPGSLKGQEHSSAQSISAGTYTNVFLVVTNTGTLVWNYGAIDCWGGVGFSTTANITIGVSGKKLKPVLSLNRARASTSQSQSVYCFAPLTLNGLVMYGGSLTSDATALGCVWNQLAAPTAFVGYEPRFNRYGFSGSGFMPTGTYTIANYGGNYGGLGDISKRANFGNTILFVMKNNAFGTALVMNSNNNGGVFNLNVTQDLTVNGFTGGIVCFADSAGVFYQATLSGGVATINDIMVGQQLNTNDTVWTRYYETTDTASLNQWAYSQQYANASSVLRGIGVASATILSLPDTNVTLSQTAANAILASNFTVDTATNTITVTANSTLDNIYDAMKAYKCTATQANLQYPSISTQPVNASGSSLVTAMNIVVNSGVTLSNGSKFTSINTSGTFTSAGVISCNVVANVTTTGTISSGVTITGNVAQATPTNLTSVSITGNLTYNTASSPTVTLTNTNVSGTVSNSGAGTVTISTSGSTIGTIGTRIITRPVTALTLNGLTAGSQVYVANGSGTQVAYVASSGTSYTLDTTGQTGTWTWKVTRYGFTSQAGTHSPAVASTTTTVTLAEDLFITQATKATVAAYQYLPNMDTLYDYAAYYETTNEGIKYARIITKAGTSASAGSYPININDQGDLWVFNGSSLSFYPGSSLAPGTTITGSLFTSATVTIPTNFGNTAITANVIQLSPGDLSGMTITGNLTYNESAPFLFTATITDSTISGTISNIDTAQVKVIIAGTSPFFTAGTNVSVVAIATIKTNSNLALSSYIIKNGGADLGWVVQNTARTLEVSATDTFNIFAIAYGYQPVLFSATATNLNSFVTSLVPETNVDTNLNTTVRNTIASTITVSIDGTGKLVTNFNTPLAQYTPAEVLNGFHYYTIISGDQIALGSLLVGTLSGFAIIQGGFQISVPMFYAQVANSVTTVTSAGFSIPLYISVTANTYITDPTYTPTRKNSSGIVLQTAPWTQQTAVVSEPDKVSIALTTWNTNKTNITEVNSMGLLIKSTANTTGLIPGLF